MDVDEFLLAMQSSRARLLRSEHIRYCRKLLTRLSSSFESLSASRPWLFYWPLHSLDLLGVDMQEYAARSAESLSRLQADTGGFRGGYDQIPHAAPTYAAVNAIMTLGSEEGYRMINRYASVVANFVVLEGLFLCLYV